MKTQVNEWKEKLDNLWEVPPEYGGFNSFHFYKGTKIHDECYYGILPQLKSFIEKEIALAIEKREQELVEEVENLREKIDYSYQNVPEEWRSDPNNVESYGNNRAVEKVLSIIRSKK